LGLKIQTLIRMNNDYPITESEMRKMLAYDQAGIAAAAW
jgi:hypothetical protein